MRYFRDPHLPNIYSIMSNFHTLSQFFVNYASKKIAVIMNRNIYCLTEVRDQSHLEVRYVKGPPILQLLSIFNSVFVNFFKGVT